MYMINYIIFLSYFSETRLVLLVMFCSQGDNIPDAVSMATHLNGWLNLVSCNVFIEPIVSLNSIYTLCSVLL